MSWSTPESFDEVKRLYRPVVQEAVQFYLDNRIEAAWVTARTFEQARRVWEAAEGEVSPLEVLARCAVFQCGLLLPRLPGLPRRRVPTEEQLFRYLEVPRFERLLEAIDTRIAVARASAREAGIDVTEDLARLEELRERMIEDFYSRRLRLDEDGEAGGGIGCLTAPPSPRRGPGGGRTFEEALALPRNP
jgi:hypothetical protein